MPHMTVTLLIETMFIAPFSRILELWQQFLTWQRFALQCVINYFSMTQGPHILIYALLKL